MPMSGNQSGVPAGTVAYFPQSSAPAGWLKCNGALVANSSYRALFNAIGSTFGSASGIYDTTLQHNYQLYSEDPGSWNDAGASIIPNIYIDPIHNALPYTIDRILDTDNAYHSNRYISSTIPASSDTWYFKFLLRKGGTTTRAAITMDLTGGNTKSVTALFAASGNAEGSSNCTVTSYDADWWLVTVSRTNDGTNTVCQIGIFPCIAMTETGAWSSAATGEISAGCFHLSPSATGFDHYVTTTSESVGTQGYFYLPDLRGEFIRSLDDSRGIDSGRSLGSAQTDAIQGHRHSMLPLGAGGGAVYGISSAYFASYTAATGTSDTENIRDAITDGTNGTPRTAAETRARNVALLACIKY